jgi:hypothetical protein
MRKVTLRSLLLLLLTCVAALGSAQTTYVEITPTTNRVKGLMWNTGHQAQEATWNLTATMNGPYGIILYYTWYLDGYLWEFNSPDDPTCQIVLTSPGKHLVRCRSPWPPDSSTRRASWLSAGR